MKLSSTCSQLLSPQLIQTLEESASVIYGVDSQYRICLMNSAWFTFAAANGCPDILASWPIGRSIFECFPPPLESFYQSVYKRGFASEHFSFDYECSSDLLQRNFRMTVYPLAEGQIVISEHALILEKPYPKSPHSNLSIKYQEDYILQCAHCRKVKASADTELWVWSADLVKNPPENISHGLCGPCLEYFYPGKGSQLAEAE